MSGEPISPGEKRASLSAGKPLGALGAHRLPRFHFCLVRFPALLCAFRRALRVAGVNRPWGNNHYSELQIRQTHAFAVRRIRGIKNIPLPLRHPQVIVGMSNSERIGELRTQAIKTLRESTELFREARRKRVTGDLERAKKMEEAARSKRADSAWLMNEAGKLETKSKIE